MSRLPVASSFGDSVFSLQPFLMEIVAESAPRVEEAPLRPRALQCYRPGGE